MNALVALALVLVGFALGGGLVFVAVRRQYDEQLKLLNNRIDRLASGAESDVHATTIIPSTPMAQPTEPPPASAPDPRLTNVVTVSGNGGTARMPVYRPDTRHLASLPIPGGSVIPPPGVASDLSMPGSLVAPPIPGMTPPTDVPSPHMSLTGPVSVPALPLPISAPEVVPAAPSTPPPATRRAAAVAPIPASRPGGAAPMTERRNTLPAASNRPLASLPPARPATAARRVEPSSLVEHNSDVHDPATANVSARPIMRRTPDPRLDARGEVTVPRGPEPIPEIPRFTSSARSDATMPMALESPTTSVTSKKRSQRDDDEVTQLDPLEPELMARLQRPQQVDAWAPSEPQLPYPRGDSVSGMKRVFEEPALPQRVGAGGELLRGTDASTNVLHIEENAWPDVGHAGGWEIDNLLGDFAKAVKQLDPTKKPSEETADEDDESKGVFKP